MGQTKHGKRRAEGKTSKVMSETRNRETEDRDRRCNKDRRDKSLSKGPAHNNGYRVQTLR